MNVSIPNLYSTACLQVDYYPQPFFRNPYGDKWQLQPGIQFMVLLDKLYTTLAYEDNHLFNLNLDIHF
jgi:hypothetical protein